MQERITIISLFDSHDIARLNNIISLVSIPLCKVPFSKSISDRKSVDTLPWHFTLSAGDITKENLVKESLKNLKFRGFTIEIDKLDILSGKENSYVLVFNIKPNLQLQEFQKIIYEILPTAKYNPETFKFHITIHISKDYEEIINLKKEIEKNFKPFKLSINKIGLFRIWPALLVSEYSSIKKV